MATRNNASFSFGSSSSNSNSGSQYNNLNMNHVVQVRDVRSAQSNKAVHQQNSTKEFSNSQLDNGLGSKIMQNLISPSKRNLSAGLESQLLPKKKNGGSSDKSTLSMHILAYQNEEEEKKKDPHVLKRKKTANKYMQPRQQYNGYSKPETMTFSSASRLLPLPKGSDKSKRKNSIVIPANVPIPLSLFPLPSKAALAKAERLLEFSSSSSESDEFLDETERFRFNCDGCRATFNFLLVFYQHAKSCTKMPSVIQTRYDYLYGREVEKFIKNGWKVKFNVTFGPCMYNRPNLKHEGILKVEHDDLYDSYYGVLIDSRTKRSVHEFEMKRIIEDFELRDLFFGATIRNWNEEYDIYGSDIIDDVEDM